MPMADPDGPEVIEPRPKAERSIASLLSDLASDTILLFRQEIELLKAELREKIGKLGQGAAALVTGALIAFSGWLVLLASAVLGLATIVRPWLAALIVAVIVLALGVALLWFGKSRLDSQQLIPKRTLRSLREDEAWLRERLH